MRVVLLSFCLFLVAAQTQTQSVTAKLSDPLAKLFEELVTEQSEFNNKLIAHDTVGACSPGAIDALRTEIATTNSTIQATTTEMQIAAGEIESLTAVITTKFADKATLVTKAGNLKQERAQAKTKRATEHAAYLKLIEELNSAKDEVSKLEQLYRTGGFTNEYKEAPDASGSEYGSQDWSKSLMEKDSKDVINKERFSSIFEQLVQSKSPVVAANLKKVQALVKVGGDVAADIEELFLRMLEDLQQEIELADSIEASQVVAYDANMLRLVQELTQVSTDVSNLMIEIEALQVDKTKQQRIRNIARDRREYIEEPAFGEAVEDLAVTLEECAAQREALLLQIQTKKNEISVLNEVRVGVNDLDLSSDVETALSSITLTDGRRCLASQFNVPKPKLDAMNESQIRTLLENEINDRAVRDDILISKRWLQGLPLSNVVVLCYGGNQAIPTQGIE